MIFRPRRSCWSCSARSRISGDSAAFAYRPCRWRSGKRRPGCRAPGSGSSHPAFGLDQPVREPREVVGAGRSLEADHVRTEQALQQCAPPRTDSTSAGGTREAAPRRGRAATRSSCTSPDRSRRLPPPTPAPQRSGCPRAGTARARRRRRRSTPPSSRRPPGRSATGADQAAWTLRPAQFTIHLLATHGQRVRDDHQLRLPGSRRFLRTHRFCIVRDLGG